MPHCWVERKDNKDRKTQVFINRVSFWTLEELTCSSIKSSSGYRTKSSWCSSKVFCPVKNCCEKDILWSAQSQQQKCPLKKNRIQPSWHEDSDIFHQFHLQSVRQRKETSVQKIVWRNLDMSTVSTAVLFIQNCMWKSIQSAHTEQSHSKESAQTRKSLSKQSTPTRVWFEANPTHQLVLRRQDERKQRVKWKLTNGFVRCWPKMCHGGLYRSKLDQKDVSDSTSSSWLPSCDLFPKKIRFRCSVFCERAIEWVYTKWY